MPAGAVDAHCHVFGPGDRFPFAPERKYTPCDASREQLFALRDHLGFARNVIVQATCHGADNSALLDALAHSEGRARGIATVRRDVSDAELERMHALGVRGVRFNFVRRLVDFTPKDELLEIASRIAPLGWHIVVYFEAADLGELWDFFTALPTPVVVDHMGRPDVTRPVDGPEFSRFMRLMREHPNVWSKVSCPERLSVAGPPALNGERLRIGTWCPSRAGWSRPFPTGCSGAPTGRIRTSRTTCPTTACWSISSPTSRQRRRCASACSSTTRCGFTGPKRPERHPSILRRPSMTNFHRRQALAGLLGLSALGPAWGQAPAYPTKVVRILVGYSPGGAVDIIARAVGQQMASGLGQPVIIENKPGGGTNIAVKTLIDSPADGYTLMLAANALAANVSLYKPAPFDLNRDITPIAQIGRVPVVLAANAQSGVASVQDLITKLKAAPGSLNYGTPGNGSTPHLAIELFAHAAGVQFTHVPYKGGSPAMNDVIAGHIQLVAVNALEVQPHIKSGKLKVLAALSAKRSPIFPDAPTIAESGFPGFEASVWYGLVGPAKLPPAVASRLHQEVQRALAAPDVRERLAAAGGEVTPGPTSLLTSLLTSETQRYEKLIRTANIQPD